MAILVASMVITSALVLSLRFSFGQSVFYYYLAIGFEPAGHIDYVQQCDILHNNIVGLVDLASYPYGPVGNSGKGHDRRTSAFHAEGRKCLREPIILKSRNGYYLGRSYGSLTTTTV